MNNNQMQWTQTTPTLSRLDYIATHIYASWNIDPTMVIPPHDAIRLAKMLIEWLDKEQTP